MFPLQEVQAFAHLQTPALKWKHKEVLKKKKMMLSLQKYGQNQENVMTYSYEFSNKSCWTLQHPTCS